ncbi:MAG: 3-hydroxyacyl-CoA dehydrogenase NAD-binding domain-containing protein [Bacteroidetes bacterium]|nr:3-hydroxyacyl-CoA dehydrogenase NAD-binding domain-containing protein [Bacteroidota bacterium]
MINITVIGSGTMGNGIAHVFAQNNFKVTVVDVKTEALEKAKITITKNLDRQVAKGAIDETVKSNTLNNLTFIDNLAEGAKNADLVIEAATENVNIKLDIFRSLDAICKPECILASNTSSIPITKIGAVTSRPEKVIGMHFMNPVPVMKLVEIIKGFKTSDEVADKIVALSKQIGKVPAVANDMPGFIANRILMPMINEAIETLFQGIGGVVEIDTVMKLGMAHPMGPLQLADFIGLDVCLAICNVLYEGFGNPKYAPCPLLVNMVTSGSLGVKSGSGFYDYSAGGKELVVASQFK